MERRYRIHILIDGEWSYPFKCYKKDDEYHNDTTHKQINRKNIY